MPSSDIVAERLGFLAWLIADGLLDIKIAILDDNREVGVYHEKLGIFADAAGNVVVFTGSSNESTGGLITNFESIDVFRSWVTADQNRISRRIEDFEALWSNTTPKLKVYEFPEAARKRLLTYRQPTVPRRDPEEPTTAYELVDLGVPKLPVGLEIRDYQKQAVQTWFEANGRGVWRMATGTGKTIAALAALSQLYVALRKRGRSLTSVVVCPFRHLVTQWGLEAKRFGITPILCHGAREDWADSLRYATRAAADRHIPFVLAIATNATFQSVDFQDLLAPIRSDFFFIADEVHNLGAAGLRRALPANATQRLGLSATPERWYDEIGTQALYEYFGAVVYELGLADAIRMGALCKYDYFPQLVELEVDELEVYADLTRRIAELVGEGDGELTADVSNPSVKSLLIKRARLLALARGKIPALRTVVTPLARSSHNLFYCGDGRVQYEPDADDRRQVDAVVRLLGKDLSMAVAPYTAETPMDERSDLRKGFADGALQGIVAIRCLDEGVDIPETRRAFILASSSNPKQFIQRRGRVLRRAPGKTMAEIHDFIVIPPPDSPDEAFEIERRLLRRELDRVVRFAQLADNGPQALRVLLPVRDKYHLLDVGT
jgi:DNA phosphorothioation system restriction enzyme